MTIDDYLKSTRLKALEFAERINRHSSYVSKLRKKKIVPSLLEALVIFKVSDGHINIEDMVHTKHLKARGLLKSDDSAVIKLIQN